MAERAYKPQINSQRNSQGYHEEVIAQARRLLYKSMTLTNRRLVVKESGLVQIRSNHDFLVRVAVLFVVHCLELALAEQHDYPNRSPARDFGL